MVLIIEDDIKLARLLQEALSQYDLKSQVVSRLSDASFKLRNQEFTFVLMDLNLEKGSKSESILVGVRNSINHLNYSTPVIVISGEFDESRVQELKGMIQGFLVKPFTVDKLFEKLQSLKLIP